MSIDVIVADDPKWMEILQQISCDFYHTSDYHKVHEYDTTNKAILIVYRESDSIVALPLLLRPLGTVEGLSNKFLEYYDATSVYGYAGPVTNHPLDDISFFERFGQALSEVLHQLKVISVFSRLHPILQNDSIITIGEKSQLGSTVSIDLLQPVDDQIRGYRKNHRRDINKAIRAEVVAFQDINWEHYDDFLHLYVITMKRVLAESSYFFGRDYFDNIRTLLGQILRLFVVKLDNVVLSAGLFTIYDDIIQYHLGASDPVGMKYASSKMLMDAVRQWGTAEGAKVFHLGGGIGSQEDSLFLFKAGFSDRRHPFKIWKYVVDNDKYDLAVQCQQKWLSMQGLSILQPNFFPLYRARLSVDNAE